MVGTTLPRIGEVMRSLIRRAGYRAWITERGFDKDLDDLAVENRSCATSEILFQVEKETLKAIDDDAGAEWAQLCGFAWHQTRASLQTFAQNVDMSPIGPAQGRAAIQRTFVIPMLVGFIQLASARISGPELPAIWSSPFDAWVTWLAKQLGASKDELLTAISNASDADARSAASPGSSPASMGA